MLVPDLACNIFKVLYAVGFCKNISFGALFQKRVGCRGNALARRPQTAKNLFIKKRRRGVKQSGGLFYSGEPSPGVLRTAARRFLSYRYC